MSKNGNSRDGKEITETAILWFLHYREVQSHFSNCLYRNMSSVNKLEQLIAYLMAKFQSNYIKNMAMSWIKHFREGPHKYGHFSSMLVFFVCFWKSNLNFYWFLSLETFLNLGNSTKSLRILQGIIWDIPTQNLFQSKNWKQKP